MNLAQMHGLVAVMDGTGDAKASMANIVALVPATAIRLGVTIEQVWAMPAADAFPALADALPSLMYDGAQADLLSAKDALQAAFSGDRLAGMKDEPAKRKPAKRRKS